ncbi:MAG: chemotaxis protein CheW [Nodosilinea sp.]
MDESIQDNNENSLASDQAVPEEQYLQINLNNESPFLLPVTDLVELMKFPLNQVVPIFQMPPWVVGVYNWRGDMLWIVDLSHFFDLVPWYEQAETAAKHTVVVIQPTEASPQEKLPAMLGLVVSEVASIVAYPKDSIQPMPNAAPLAPGVWPFLQGGCGYEAGQLSWVLNSQAILAAVSQAHG